MFSLISSKTLNGKSISRIIASVMYMKSKHTLQFTFSIHNKEKLNNIKKKKILCKHEHLEAVARRCFVKKVFLELSQNSQENTSGGCFWALGT